MLIWILLSKLSSPFSFQLGSHVIAFLCFRDFCRVESKSLKLFAFLQKPDILKRLCWLSGRGKRRGRSASENSEGESSWGRNRRDSTVVLQEREADLRREDKVIPQIEFDWFQPKGRSAGTGPGHLKSPTSQPQVRGNIGCEQEHRDTMATRARPLPRGASPSVSSPGYFPFSVGKGK